jgi:hypothetical protein
MGNENLMSFTSKRIDSAIEVIQYAINNNVSVREASLKCGFSNTYVKNIKAMVHHKFNCGELNIIIYNKFDKIYQEYLLMRQEVPQTQLTDKNSNNNKILEPNKPKDIPNNGNRESFKINGNQGEFEWVGGSNYPIDHVRTLDQLLLACKVNREEWLVKDTIINKWDITSWKSGEPKTVQNWQVKARLERNNQYVKERVVGEIFQEMTQNYVPPILKYNTINRPQKSSENNLLEISIFDLHIGKLAWAGETFENYDVKIARERFLTSIITLMQHASGFNYNRILFPVGSDFFNSDTINNTTTSGTPQDEDLRWQKTFDVGVRLLIDAINLMKQNGVPIDIVVIPGNHDFERSYYMGKYLEAWFNNDDTVTINNGASPRKYYRYGNLLLGLTHGSEEKESSLPMLMATDIVSKPLWSVTKFHEWHLGHIHRKRIVQYDINKSRLLNEDLGVTVRYLSSLTGTEEWHHKKGFIGSTKAADAFVWNFDYGLIAHLNSNLILE